MQRSVPSGTFSIFWIVARIVPIPAQWVVRAGIFDVFVFEHDETVDLLAFAQRFFDQRDTRPFDDGERNHGGGEVHGVLQRQNASRTSGVTRILRGAIRPRVPLNGHADLLVRTIREAIA